MKSFGPFLGSSYKFGLFLFDILIMSAVAVLVSYLRLGSHPVEVFLDLQFWVVAGFSLFSLYILGGYDLDLGLSKTSISIKQFVALSISLASLVIINYLFSIDRAGLFGRGIFLGTIFGFFAASLIYRWAAISALSSIREKLSWLVIINEKEKAFFEADRRRLGFQGKIYFLDPQQATAHELDSLLDRMWSAVVLGMRGQDGDKEFLKTLMQAKFAGHRVMDLGRFYEKHWLKVPVYFLDPEWFISSEGFESITHPTALRLKRICDIILASLIFIPALPLMLLTALAVKLESPGSVIYEQIRTGKDGRHFSIYKFRSMRNDAEKDGAKWAQENDNRITRVGKLIRLTRLDELPQLWNVLRGDMSFVGPRPERPEFNEMLAREIPFYNLRHTMPPGLTGWAQVLYPYGASIEDSREKLQYELYYAKHYNPFMDILIFFKTIRVVLFGRGR